MKSLVVVILGGLLAVMAATTAHAQTPDLAALLRQHYDALNRGDVAAVMATFADDAVLVRGTLCTPPAGPCAGKAGIQREIEIEVRDRFLVTITDLQVSGETATARVENRWVVTQNAGVERAIQKHSVTFRGDKIARFVAEPDLSDPQTVAVAEFLLVTAVRGRQNAALNSGDVAGVMALIADDGVFEGFGLCALTACVGKAAIQKEIERQVTDGIRIAPVPGTVRVSGDTFTSRLQISSNSIRAAGAERVIASVSGEVKGGKTILLRFVLDTTDPQTAAFLAARRLPAGGVGPTTDNSFPVTSAAVISLGGLLLIAGVFWVVRRLAYRR